MKLLLIFASLMMSVTALAESVNYEKSGTDKLGVKMKKMLIILLGLISFTVSAQDKKTDVIQMNELDEEQVLDLENEVRYQTNNPDFNFSEAYKKKGLLVQAGVGSSVIVLLPYKILSYVGVGMNNTSAGAQFSRYFRITNIDEETTTPWAGGAYIKQVIPTKGSVQAYTKLYYQKALSNDPDKQLFTVMRDSSGNDLVAKQVIGLEVGGFDNPDGLYRLAGETYEVSGNIEFDPASKRIVYWGVSANVNINHYFKKRKK